MVGEKPQAADGAGFMEFEPAAVEGALAALRTFFLPAALDEDFQRRQGMGGRRAHVLGRVFKMLAGRREFWRGAGRPRERSFPAERPAVPQDFCEKGRPAWLRLGRSPMKGILARGAAPANLFRKNRITMVLNTRPRILRPPCDKISGIRRPFWLGRRGPF